MSLATKVSAAILETILNRLAPLFLIGTAGDIIAARHAAAQMLGAYQPETEDELCLAANIIGFSFHALEALSQASAVDLPITRVIRLRGSAVSLSRESEKAHRRLAQLQKARQQAVAAEIHPAAEPVIDQPRVENTVGKANAPAWTQANDRRQEEIRIAASLKRAEARVAALANAPTPDQHARTLMPAV